jgi:UTP--glucose-1-phosphate uridylyltransferase
MARMERTIRKAVFPAAGLGTRFLPATKVLPKEMLVLVDKPVIQYGVEEAIQSGITDIAIVTSRGKSSMEDHFDVAFELETVLERRGKTQQLDEIRRMAGVGRVSYVRQSEPLGLGHAVLMARSLVGEEPFGVILSDDVIDANPPALKQLMDVYARVGGPVIAVETVPMEDVSSYGVVAIDESAQLGPGVFRITDLVEKPPRNEAPSNLAIIGRYALTPDIFPALEATASDRTGEIQLTNGLRRLLRDRPLYACKISGVRHDTGNKLGLLKAFVYFALQRPDLAEPLRRYLETLPVKSGVGTSDL